MNIREIRSKVNEFFRSRGLPTAEKLSDEAAQAVHERWVSGRKSYARSTTRNARLRANDVAPTEPVVTEPAHESTDSLSERERRHLQAIAAAAL